jgi:predicted lipoprotein with Yx(FWY)xxD motif
MRLSNRWISLPAIVTGVALIASACSSAASPSSTVLGATTGPVVTPAVSSVVIGMTNGAAMGAYLTGPNGMTLYVFAVDKPDTSNCSGACATTWPALTVPAGTTITPPAGATGAFTLITRAGGQMQVAYNHLPLYYYSKDKAAGDTNGQGFAGKWFVAPLSGVISPAAPTASPAAVPSSTATYSGY